MFRMRQNRGSKEDQMKAVVFIILASSLLLSCQDKEVQYRTPEKKAAAAGSNLIINIPGPTSFKMSNGQPADFLISYLLRITSKSKKCQDFQTYELKDYTGAGNLVFPVNNKCAYLVHFAIGKKSEEQALQGDEPSFNAFYTTEDSFNVTAADFETGDVTIKLHLKRTTLGEKIGFTEEWIKDDLAESSTDQDTTKDPVDDAKDDQKEEPKPTGKISYADLIDEIETSCAGCHRPGGSRSKSDLSTYESFKKYGASAVTRIIAESMPPSGPLAAAKIAMFKTWRDSGFPEKSTSPIPGASTGSKIIEFRIKAGTGDGAWNTAESQIEAKVGQTVRIINDDTVKHRFHTNGAPCPHGNDIQPGKSEDCVISKIYTGSPLYDHNTLGKVYIRATN
jgi:hypothetical protein